MLPLIRTNNIQAQANAKHKTNCQLGKPIPSCIVVFSLNISLLNSIKNKNLLEKCFITQLSYNLTKNIIQPMN